MTEQELLMAKKAKADYQKTYMKKWRAKNPDKVRENNLRYWARRAEREAAIQKEQGEVQNNG